MNSLYAGLDVGGTSVKLLVVNAGGTIVHREAFPAETVDTVAQLTRIAAHAVKLLPEIRGIGVVTPGTVNDELGTVDFASNLDLAGHNIPEAILAACGRPARLGHDGRAAGLAESLFGAARAFSSSVVVPVGTGISAAICQPAGVWAGASQIAGEIGHIPVFPGGEACACGQFGCLDVYSSGKGIARRYLAATGTPKTAGEIAQSIDSDAAAAEVWATAVEAFSLVFTQLTFTLDPEGIVVGGGLSRAGDVLLDPIRRRMGELLAWRDAPTLVTTTLGDNAGQWGAAVLGCRAAESTDYEGWKP